MGILHKVLRGCRALPSIRRMRKFAARETCLTWFMFAGMVWSTGSVADLAQAAEERKQDVPKGAVRAKAEPSKSKSASPVNPDQAGKGTPKGFGKQENIALSFAREHHAELAELVAHLKNDSPLEYEQAVRELFRVRERLSQLQKRNPERYPLELELWKTKSRMRLMAARLSMGKDATLELQFREAFRRRREIQLELLELERVQLQTRLAEVNSELERSRRQPKSRGDVDVQRALEKIRKADAGRRATGASVAQESTIPAARDGSRPDSDPK